MDQTFGLSRSDLQRFRCSQHVRIALDHMALDHMAPDHMAPDHRAMAVFMKLALRSSKPGISVAMEMAHNMGAEAM